MEAHPGVVFRTGPAGRRPGLAGRPDVREVVCLFKGIDGHGDAALRRTAELAGLSPIQVRTCTFGDVYPPDSGGNTGEIRTTSQPPAVEAQR